MQISHGLSKVKNRALVQANNVNLFSGFEEPTRSLTDEERLDWLRLIRTQNVGPITFHQLIQKYGSAGKALEALPELSRLGGNPDPIKIYPKNKAEAELDTVHNIGARLVALNEPDYPSILSKIDMPPPLLYMKGDFSLVTRPALSIVGSRNGSAAGRQFTKIIAKDLSHLGYVIASGLARGIDTAAHEASLDSGTIAVVAGGVDIQYPPENADLQNRIGETGLLISENPPGFKPRGKDFPRRNRIISGLAHAILIIEAATKSGSLITARYALEHNRELFAVPGNPLDPRSEGTNNLIKKGANMLTCADDVTEILAPMLRSLPLYMEATNTNFPDPALTPEQKDVTQSNRQKIMLALGPTPTDIDELIRCTHLPPGVVHTVLIELDLAGKIERHGQQKISLLASNPQGSFF